MAISLSNLVSSKSDKPPITTIYGVGKIGKTSLAAEYPDPIYLPTDGERTPDGIDVPTPGVIETFGDLLNVFTELLTEQHDRKTVIIDSLDGLEPLIWSATCERLNISSIEEPGYGKGYVEADKEWHEYFQAISALKANGLAVVQIAQAQSFDMAEVGLTVQVPTGWKASANEGHWLFLDRLTRLFTRGVASR